MQAGFIMSGKNVAKHLMHSSLLRFLAALFLGLWFSQAYSKPDAADQAAWDVLLPFHIKRVPANLREKVRAYDVAALVEVARMFEHGRGVPKDPVFASQWYWRAEYMGRMKFIASPDDAANQLDIPSIVYSKAIALRSSGDEGESARLMFIAARGGYPEAHREWGLAYFSGKQEAFPQDIKLGLFHLKRSAIHGKNVADNHIVFGALAKIYDNAETEYYDPEQAYYFMLLASKLVSAYETTDWAKRYDKITDQQKSDIKKKANQWRAGKPFWEASITLAPPYSEFDANSHAYGVDEGPAFPVLLKRIPQKFREKILAKDTATLFKVAEMFEHGRGVPKDINFAVEWYGRAAGDDSYKAKRAAAWWNYLDAHEKIPALMLQKANLLSTSPKEDSDMGKGEELLFKAVKAGYPPAHAQLGRNFLRGSGSFLIDIKAAITHLKKAASDIEVNTAAVGLLASIYDFGYFDPEHTDYYRYYDPEQAYYYILMARQFLPPYANSRDWASLGALISYSGDLEEIELNPPFPPDWANYYDKLSAHQKTQIRKKVAEWKAGKPLWEAASRQAAPLPVAHNNSWDVMLPIHAKRVPADLHKKVMAHDVTTWIKVAQMFEHGQGVSKDPDFAAQWYWRAELMGSKQARAWREKEEAREEIPAVIYGKGAGLGMFRDEQKTTQALALIRKAADAGYAPAHLDLGVMYFKGRNIPKDIVAALTHLKQSAIQGENIDGNHIVFALMAEIYNDSLRQHFNPQQAYYFMLMAHQLMPSYDTYKWLDRHGLPPRQKADIKKRAAQWKAGSPFWEAAVK